MLLKGCQTSETEKKSRTSGNKQHRSTANAMRLTNTVSSPRGQRKMVQRVGSKRPAPGKRIAGHGMLEVPAVDPCDSSNDSGLGFEHHSELHMARSALRYSDHELHWANQGTAVKRKKMEIKLESDDANDNFTFEETIQAKRDPMHAEMTLPLTTQLPPVRSSVARVVSRRPAVATVPRRGGAPTSAANQQLAFSRAAPKPFLQILSQPEQQHRARYQTEGSRGAVKDRTGNSFPAVKLVGYEGQATLQVFIGSDVGRAVPHMFYQACRVSGKNSTPCTEKTVDGTVVIEVEFDAAKDMIVTCDCVGILKERNVDVEHRFPDQSGARSKKKSTRCRMVFRAVVTLADGTKETLEVTSQHIVCTQPPGIPEICKKSLCSSPCVGGQELFILGKNFLKDTCVVFTNSDVHPPWEVAVTPDKEYLQQSHLVCVVPAYVDAALTAPVAVRLSVTSSGKTSESHSFTYTPSHVQAGNCEETQKSVAEVQSGTKQLVGSEVSEQAQLPTIGGIVRPANAQYLFVQSAQDGGKDAVFLWKPQPAQSSKLTAEEPSAMVMAPASQTRPIFLVGHIPASQKVPVEDGNCSPTVPRSAEQEGMEMHKTMLAAMPAETAADNHFPTTTTMDQFSSTTIGLPISAMPTSESLAPIRPEPHQHYAARNHAVPMATGADLSSTQSPSLATLRRFVSSDNTGSPLPSLSVEKFLSGLEHKTSDLGQHKTLPLFPDSVLRSTLSVCKGESCGLPTVSAKLPNLDERQMPQALQGNIGRIEDSSLYQPQQPLNTSLHNPISIPHSAVSTAYGDQLMQAQLMLHGQPTTTTTMTIAKTQNVSSNLISEAQNARLDAMVSSAMESTASTQGGAQKLEDLLNSTADSHLESPRIKDEVTLPLTVPSSMPLAAISKHVFAECKVEGAVEGTSVEMSSQSGMIMMPSVFEPSLHTSSLLSPALISNGQMINQPIGELLCNTVNSMAITPACSPEALIIDETGSVMQGTGCATNAMLDMPCTSNPMMISAQCTSDSTVMLETQSTVVQMPETSQCHSSSIALTNMIMHSAASSASLFHPVQAAPMMQNMLLSAADRANDQLPTPETVRLDALVNSALDSHILPAVVPEESKCAIFPGTSAVDCQSAGVCPSVETCYAPVNTANHCCTEQLHFVAAASVVDETAGRLVLPAAMDKVKCQAGPGLAVKREEVMVPRELTQMSENDLLSYINPSCFDTL